jgi:hypothetical protein
MVSLMLAAKDSFVKRIPSALISSSLITGGFLLPSVLYLRGYSNSDAPTDKALSVIKLHPPLHIQVNLSR